MVLFPRFLIVLGLFLSSVDARAGAQDVLERPALHTGSALPSAEALKACFQTSRSAECLDELYREPLSRHSTLDALQQLQRLESVDLELRRDCHPIVHAIGRETFRLKGNIHDAFSACDQTCHSGCYHGAVERFLRGDDLYAQSGKHPSESELRQKAATACNPNAPSRLYFQCLHGLGHALMFFSRYQLRTSLEACDALPDSWSQSSCWGGVFMENVFNATPEKRDLSATDYHYPCNAVDLKYRSECYLMQTSRMSEMGLATPQLFKECDKAGEHAMPCTLSIGRDLSNEVRLGQTTTVATKCELVSGNRRTACIRGVIYALIDNTWDGRYALPFCMAFSAQADRSGCIKDSVQYLRATFAKSGAEIAQECERHFKDSRICADSS
jgi:hypothetical protein